MFGAVNKTLATNYAWNVLKRRKTVSHTKRQMRH